eukprot:8701293-Pyramimonas_sp.AAC.1
MIALVGHNDIAVLVHCHSSGVVELSSRPSSVSHISIANHGLGVVQLDHTVAKMGRCREPFTFTLSTLGKMAGHTQVCPQSPLHY